MMKFKKNYVMQDIYFWNCVKKNRHIQKTNRYIIHL